MHRTHLITAAAALLALLLAACLAGCSTVNGMGRDLQAVSHGIAQAINDRDRPDP